MTDEEYLQYIKNTGHVPLKTEVFDEDWEPVGPMARQRLVRLGLIVEAPDGIRIASITRPAAAGEGT